MTRDDDASQRLRASVCSEVVKAATLPSIAATAAGCVLISGAVAFTIAVTTPPTVPLDGTPRHVVVIGHQSLTYAQVVFILLGVLFSASEYEAGQIATSLAATPRRPILYNAKAVICLAALAVTAVVSVSISLGLAAIGLSSGQAQSAFTADSSTPTAAAAAQETLSYGAAAIAYLALIGLIGFAAGTIARNTSAATASMLTALILSALAHQLTRYGEYLPTNAAAHLAGPAQDSSHIGRWASIAVTLAWAAASWATSEHVFNTRDG